MKALILAAGYGTRLYPLTKNFPKTLLKIGKKPIINHIIEKIAILDEINEIIIVTNSKFMPLFKKWRSCFKFDKPISLVDDLTFDEVTKRGAIGDMDFAISGKRIRDNLLVFGGDNLLEDNLTHFLSFARSKKLFPVIGIYDIKNKKKASHYGVVRLDRNNKIINFEEKPKNPKSTLVAMCLYYFPKKRLKLIKEYMKNKMEKKDATGFYISWLRKKAAVYGFVFSGLWFDIGQCEFYKKAQEKFVR